SSLASHSTTLVVGKWALISHGLRKLHPLLDWRNRTSHKGMFYSVLLQSIWIEDDMQIFILLLSFTSTLMGSLERKRQACAFILLTSTRFTTLFVGSLELKFLLYGKIILETLLKLVKAVSL
ncbi:hypothetical protein ACJX0J_005934, partial [Zea mays]